MKEIFYKGSLRSDIFYSKNKYSDKEERHVNIFYGIGFGLMMFACFIGLGAVLEISIDTLAVLIFIGLEAFGIRLYSNKMLKKSKENYLKSQMTANDNLESLSKELSKENIDVLKKDLQEAVQRTEKIIRKTLDDNNEVIFEDDKIIRYFHLLDKNDQYVVLMQIRNNLLKNRKLFLLEEDDLQTLEYKPSVKQLKLQKNDNK